MIRFLSKIFIALLPIFFYILIVWLFVVFVKRNKSNRFSQSQFGQNDDLKVVNGTSRNLDEDNNYQSKNNQNLYQNFFNLDNKYFLFCLYLSLFLLIFNLIWLAFKS